jgi:hypothetical protein
MEYQSLARLVKENGKSIHFMVSWCIPGIEMIEQFCSNSHR